MSDTVVVHPKKACHKGGGDLMLSYYQPIPDSNYYTVTFRSDSSGRPASSRADAERVNDFTLTLRLPSHERPEKVRINVFGESAFQLPVAEFEFVGVGAMLLSSLPTPVQPQQVLAVMLMMQDKEIHDNSTTFDMELMATMSGRAEPISSLNICDILEDTPLSLRDDLANLFHICGKYSLHVLANFVLSSPQLFPEAALSLNEVDSTGRKPADVAMDSGDFELNQLFCSRAASGGEVPVRPEAKSSSGKAHKNKVDTLKSIGKMIRSSSIGGDDGSPRLRSSTNKGNSLSRRLPLMISSHDSSQGEGGHSASSPSAKKKAKNMIKKIRHREKDGKRSESPSAVISSPLSPEPEPKKKRVLTSDEIWELLQKVEDYGRVIRTYEPSAYAENRLRLQVGDILHITEKLPNGNWSGLLNKKEFGSFPFIHVDCISKEEAEKFLSERASFEGTSRPPAVEPDKRRVIFDIHTPLPKEPNSTTARSASQRNLNHTAAPAGQLSQMAASLASSLSSRDSRTSELSVEAGNALDDEFYDAVLREDETSAQAKAKRMSNYEIEVMSDEDDEIYDQISEDGKVVCVGSGSGSGSGNVMKTAPGQPPKQTEHQLALKKQLERNMKPKPQPGPAAAKPTATPSPPATQRPAMVRPGVRGSSLASPDEQPAPPPTFPSSLPDPDSPDTQWYEVIHQGDVIKAYKPDGTDETRDFLRIKVGDCINVLCVPPGENWALVEMCGRTGRAFQSYFRERAAHLPIVKNKLTHLHPSLSYIECIVPSDHVAVGVDPKTEDLVICGVEKDELDECDVDFPDPELPPPPPIEPVDDDSGDDYVPADPPPPSVYMSNSVRNPVRKAENSNGHRQFSYSPATERVVSPPPVARKTASVSSNSGSGFRTSANVATGMPKPTPPPSSPVVAQKKPNVPPPSSPKPNKPAATGIQAKMAAIGAIQLGSPGGSPMGSPRPPLAAPGHGVPMPGSPGGRPRPGSHGGFR